MDKGFGRRKKKIKDMISNNKITKDNTKQQRKKFISENEKISYLI
jgi:hypothetical protein